MNELSKRWVIGVTGASGTVYARTLIQTLLENDPDVFLDVIFSEAALRVLREEEQIKSSTSTIGLEKLIALESKNIKIQNVKIHNNRDIGADIASGSVRTAGMVIVPCSMSTLAAVAHGLASNLIHRAADVTIKEGRKLVIVPRETPLSAIHLENMLKLAKIGVSIVPAMPGFYHQPVEIKDLVNMMVLKITDVMGYQFDTAKRWKSSPWPVAPVASVKAVHQE